MNLSSKAYIPYGRHTVTDEDIEAVKVILTSDYLTQGPTVPAFEEGIASRVGAKYGIAMNSATSALHTACLALEIGPGDIVWTSPVTFVASSNCALYTGAQVDFVDIDEDTGLMSISRLKEKLTRAKRERKLPKLVIPVHLGGVSCEMKEIWRLSKEYGFKIIEDASHAIGGCHEGKMIGDCRFSDICIFSFHPVKIITTAEGGLATTNSRETAQKMRDLRSHGIVKDAERFECRDGDPWTYEQQSLGFNYRMTDVQAALGLSQLNRLDRIIMERRRQLKRYSALLENSQCKVIQSRYADESAAHLSIVRVGACSKSEHRSIFTKMRESGIGVQLHYSPVHLQPYYQKMGFKAGDYVGAEKYASSCLSLPLYPGLTEEEQERVCQSLMLIIRR